MNLANLVNATLKKAKLSEAILFQANLYSADLAGSQLEKANLVGANLVKADLEAANLKQAKLIDANLFIANLRNVNAEGADLSETDLRGTVLQSANLRNAILARAKVAGDLKDANLEGAVLENADLSGADFTNAKLIGANLRGTTWGSARLTNTQLALADLRGANLRGAHLNKTNLCEARLSEPKIKGLRMPDGTTILGVEPPNAPRSTYPGRNNRQVKQSSQISQVRRTTPPSPPVNTISVVIDCQKQSAAIEARARQAEKFQAIAQKYGLIGANSKPEDVGQYALETTKLRVRNFRGTPKVVLARRVSARELPTLGFGGSNIDRDRPLMLVIIDGDFDITGLRPGFGDRYGTSRQPRRYYSIAYVYDLCVGAPTLTTASPRPGGFRQAMKPSSSPSQQFPAACRPPKRV
jgi:uncharacterized protein YjbI with pentapeptide repeats